MIISTLRKSALASAILLSTTGTAMAASFQILEQSPSHLGHAFAGTASNVHDATTVFFNPAGMSQLEGSQVTVAGNLIFTRADFHDRGSNTGGIEGRTKETGFVPNLYYVQPINERWTFGFGANAPFGLASDFGQDWMGRYLATHSELRVVNLNATFAYEVNDNLAFGIGINYQRADVTLESQVDSTLGVNPGLSTDSSARIEGSDYAIAGDFSVFFRPVESTTFGLVWRQGATFTLDGDAQFTLNDACTPGAGFPTGAPPAPTTGSICAAALTAIEGSASAEVDLPDTVTFSVSHRLDDRWTVHGDWAWTDWSSIQTVDVINRANGVPVDELELFYEDTWRYALGVTYVNESPWTWRAGIARDRAPQTDPYLVNPRIPDQNRTWLSAGFNYAFSNELSLDVGYAHLLIKTARINNADEQTGHVVRGHFKPTVNIIGAQVNWLF